MNDEMIRSRIHAAMDDCLSGVEKMPSQRAAIMARIEGKRSGAKLSAIPAFALMMALLLALAGVGIAASLGLFGQIRSSKVDEWSYTRLGLLEDAAVTVGKVEGLTIPGTEQSVELTIDQAYCDGRKLYYSYTLREEPSEIYHSSVGDGADLLDGTYLNPVDSGYGTTEDGAATAYYEVALPEDLTLGETITFELLIMNYVNGQYDREKNIRVPVTVPVTGDLTVLRGEGMLDEYYAKARLFVSDVDISGTVEIAAPEGDEPRHIVLIVDGVPTGWVDWSARYGSDMTALEVRFDLPENAQDAQYALAYDEQATETLALERGE